MTNKADEPGLSDAQKENYTACPDDNMLGAYLDGALSEPKKRFVDIHMERCNSCRFAVQLASEETREAWRQGKPRSWREIADAFVSAGRSFNVQKGNAIFSPAATCEAGAPEFVPGARLGQYEIIHPLGLGGMGLVLLARDIRLGRLVAIKMLLDPLLEQKQRFLREARATARLNHENIVTIHEVNEHEGMPFMVLEYLRGQTLSKWRRERQGQRSGSGARVSAFRAVELMSPVVRALVAAHDAGIMHRDLKPGNIILTDKGGVKVLDFGLAKAMGSQEALRSAPREQKPSLEEPAQQASDLTAAGTVLGTLPYMSPEQLCGKQIDERTDLWAVGIMLYELVVGHHPIVPLTQKRICEVVRDGIEPMPSVLEERADLKWLGPVIDRCLMTQRKERYQSARELLADLERSCEGKTAPRGKDENPFPGLLAFQESDADRYFGREEEGRQAAIRLSESTMLTVVGPSGAGKSSFVQAGLIPYLKRGAEGVEAHIMRPGPRPLAALAELLNEDRKSHSTSRTNETEMFKLDRFSSTGRLDPALITQLAEEPGYLAMKLRERAERGRGLLLLFVDQLEEVYTLCNKEERSQFLRCLKGVADHSDSPLRLVLSMRSDFLERLGEGEERLWQEVSQSLFLLGELGKKRLRAALEKPLEGTWVKFESAEMVDEMVRVLHETKGALPLLQFTAGKLWEERDRKTGILSYDVYREFGGIGGTLSRHADEVMERMTEQESQVAREVFLRLVTPERTRMIVRRRDLVAAFNGREAQLEAVLSKLIESRLLIGTGGRKRGSSVELVHESLIAKWPWLQRWLNENQEDAEFLERLRNASAEWAKSGKQSGLLWRGLAAEEGRHWLVRYRRRGADRVRLSRLEEEYLEEVRNLVERAARQRRRWILGGFVVLSLVAVAMSLLGWRASQEKDRALQESKRAQQEAMRARDAARMGVLEKWRNNDTMRLVILRDIEAEKPPIHWQGEIRQVLTRPTSLLVLSGHTGYVQHASWSPDGQYIVSSSYDGTARLWRADGQGEPLILAGHDGPVTSAAWSPDGKHIVTSSEDKMVRVWQADGRGKPLILAGHAGPVTSASWSPDGQQIVSASTDGTARVWRADGRGRPRVLSGHEGFVWSAGYSPDGLYIATASADEKVRVWRADGQGEPLVLSGHTDHVTSVRYSPDGQHIISSSRDKTARLWRTDGQGKPLVLSGHGGYVWSASYSPDGQHIVTSSADKTVRVWRADGQGKPLVLSGHEASVWSASYSPNGKYIVSSSWDKTVRVWQSFRKEDALIFSGHTNGVRSVSYSPNGQYIVTASHDKTVRVWHADGQGEPLILSGHTAYVNTASYSLDGQSIVTASDDTTVRVWRADGQGEPLILSGHTDNVNSASFSPDGKQVVSGSDDETVRVWRLDGQGDHFILSDNAGSASSVSYSPDGKHIVAAFYNGLVRIWRADEPGNPVVLSGHTGAVFSASYSPDGRHIVTASHDKTARVWRADGRGDPVVLAGHTDFVYYASYSPDGKHIVTGSFDNTVRVWRADGRGEPAVLVGHETTVTGVTFSPDGQRIASSSHDQTVRIWREFELIHPGDERLWTATNHCLSVEAYKVHLGFERDVADRCRAKCRRMVRAFPSISPD